MCRARYSCFVSHAGRFETSFPFCFFFCGLALWVWVKNLQPWLSLSASSVLHSTNTSPKPQPQQPSLILCRWRTLYLAFPGFDATRPVQEAQTRGRVTTDIDASFVGAVELLPNIHFLSNIHSTSQKTLQYDLTCFQLGCAQEDPQTSRYCVKDAPTPPARAK